MVNKHDRHIFREVVQMSVVSYLCMNERAYLSVYECTIHFKKHNLI